MKEDKKKQILDVAIKLFKNNGFQNISIDAIVKKAGIAKGTFFYHFEKKDNLIFKIIDMEFEKYLFIPEQIVLDKEISADKKMEKVIMTLFSAFKTTSLLEEIFKYGVPIQFEKYMAELRLKKIVPVITAITKQGKNEGLFLLENIDVISSILVRGIVAHINITYKYLNDPEILKSMLLGIEELINNALKTTNRICIQ